MLDWSEQNKMVRKMFRSFCEKEIVPHLDALDREEMSPYPILRKLFKQFGLGAVTLGEYKKRIAKQKAIAAGDAPAPQQKTSAKKPKDPEQLREMAAMRLIPVVELCRYVPGMVTALGVSVGLTPSAIMSKGSIAQKEKFVPDLLTLKTIGAWAITEPGSGSDAFGSMRTTARLEGDTWVLNGAKTFITNGPFADVVVLYAKYDEGDGTPMEKRRVLQFILDGDTPGLVRSKPFRKMGMHSSPTGELFLEDVRVGMDRLMGESLDANADSRASAKATFGQERTGVAAMALGIIERCLELCVEYAKTRKQFGKRIGDYQLIQLKLAKMQVARTNVQNMLFRQIELAAHGRSPSLAEASATKLYCAQAAMETTLEAIQLHGGYGYMAEYRVEQLARDAKVLQIYGGTDEIQVGQIARDLLRE